MNANTQSTAELRRAKVWAKLSDRVRAVICRAATIKPAGADDYAALPLADRQRIRAACAQLRAAAAEIDALAPQTADESGPLNPSDRASWWDGLFAGR